MEGRYGLYSQSSSDWTSMRNEEFEEEDVWSILKDKNSTYNSKPIPIASRIIPSANNSLSSTHERNLVQQSAPVNIPDWSKIYGKKKKNTKASWLDDDDDDGDGDGDGDGGDGDMVPPHEWLANKLERSHISTSSVCEGAGRTLKGRDLSRVRDAVLTKTGFLE